MRTIKRKIVAAMIFSKEGKLFQAMKSPKSGGVYLEGWHIPGGGVEVGETEEQALVREIREETGMDISQCKISLLDDAGKGVSEKTLEDSGERVLCEMDFKVYEVEMDCPSEQINVILGDEFEKYTWTDTSELKNKKLTPPSEELFKRLGYF